MFPASPTCFGPNRPGAVISRPTGPAFVALPLAQPQADRILFTGAANSQPTAIPGKRFKWAAGEALSNARRAGDPALFIHALRVASYVLDNGGSEAEGVKALQTASLPIGGLPRLPRKLQSALVDRERFYQTGATDSDASPQWRRFLTADTLAAMQAHAQGFPGTENLPNPAGLSGKSLTGLQDVPPRRELARTLEEAAAQPPVPSVPTAGKPPVIPGPRFLEALALALDLHRDQTRRDTHAPYAVHLMHAAATVLAYGGSEDAAIAALLHDALEDQGNRITLEAIRKRFGNAVAEMVADCTMTPPADPWRQARDRHLKHMAHLRNPESALILGADLMHNLLTMRRTFYEKRERLWEQFTGNRDEQLWYARSVLSAMKHALGMRAPLVQVLARQVEALDSIAHLTGSQPIHPETPAQRRERINQAAMRQAEEATRQNPVLARLDAFTRSLPSTFPTGTTMIDGRERPDFPPWKHELHRRIVDLEYQKYLDSRDPNRPHTGVAHIVTGPMGAGKTSKVAEPLARRDNAFQMDPDVLKGYLRGYHIRKNHPAIRDLNLRARNGLGASAVQREGSYIGDLLMEKILDNRDSFVVSYIGRDLGWDYRYIRQLKGLGYQVYVHHVELPLTTAITRVLKRFAENGRYTPPQTLVRLSRESTDNFIKLRDWGLETGLIDGYTWVNNDVGKTDPVIPVETFNFIF